MHAPSKVPVPPKFAQRPVVDDGSCELTVTTSAVYSLEVGVDPFL